MKFFSLDTPIMQKLNKYACLIIMNILWVLCSLPVFTIGASTAAMYSVLFKLRENDSASPAEFFQAFKDSFKHATLIWLTVLGSLLLLGSAYWGTLYVELDVLRLILVLIVAALALIWFLAGLLVFPLTAYFENSVKNTLKNAVLVALRYIRKMIPCAALTILPVLIADLDLELFLRLLFLWLCVLSGLIAYIKSGLILKIFEDLSPKEASPELQ